MSDRVTIMPAPPMRRFSLRARDSALLASIIGLPLPMQIGETQGNIARLGPDEYYGWLPHDADLPCGAGQAVSIVDVSARALGLIVVGQSARAVLSSGCPLDLDRFAVGRATRTIYETVEIILYRVSEMCWHVDVWRSFAPWLWAALVQEATQRD